MTDFVPATNLVLASQSPFRAAMLQAAGLAIEAEPADLDERSVEAPLVQSGADAADIAAVLAEAKAQTVDDARRARGLSGLVIGCDQTLSLDGRAFHKPTSMEEARRNLLKLSGRSHQLNSAVVLVEGGATVWRHTATAHMHVRRLSPRFVGHYLARVGEKALQSVGSYQIEGEGVQLFDAIEGDHFTIVGLPLLPLLAALRDRGVLEA